MRRIYQPTLNPGSGVAYVGSSVFQVCSAYTSTCAVIPLDNTKPENTEGVEIVDAQFTPTSTGHVMQVEVNWNATISKGAVGIAALFHSSSSMAKEVSYISSVATDAANSSNFVFKESVPSTATQSYSLRIGTSASGKPIFVNGDTGAQLFNGALFYSISVTELATG